MTNGTNITNNGINVTGQTILDYDNMATADPGVRGQLWRNGNQIYISAGI